LTLADVNILVNALRPDAHDHARCRGWLDAEVNSGAPFGLARNALSGVLRITTHPHIYPTPTPIHEALDFCTSLLGAPQAKLVDPGPRHWTLFEKLVRDNNCTGNDIPDAWFAALAIESGCTWVTLDRGFARFKGLTTKAP
jgi:toxin-antitoxin system PIN domain toxin